MYIACICNDVAVPVPVGSAFIRSDMCRACLVVQSGFIYACNMACVWGCAVGLKERPKIPLSGTQKNLGVQRSTSVAKRVRLASSSHGNRCWSPGFGSTVWPARVLRHITSGPVGLHVLSAAPHQQDSRRANCSGPTIIGVTAH